MNAKALFTAKLKEFEQLHSPVKMCHTDQNGKTNEYELGVISIKERAVIFAACIVAESIRNCLEEEEK